MNITPQTPRPQPPRNQRGSRLSWLFFLLILARPLWGIIRSLVGPQVTNQQIWLVLGGVVLAGVVVMLITRGASRFGSGDQSLSMPNQPVRDYRPPTGRGRDMTWTAPRPGSYQGQTPRFEPMITGKVVLVGLILAVVLIAGLAIIMAGMLATGVTP
jgi:hypothetical protein